MTRSGSSALAQALTLAGALVPASAAADRPLVTLPVLAEAPRVDGRMNDAAWAQALVIEDFRQVEPRAGAQPSERTRALLGYHAGTVYVGIYCYDREPARIVARHLREDSELYDDDSVYVAFDTFLDRRNAFMFATNPLGAKRDVRIENNANYRPEWNGIWTVEAHRQTDGYSVEMAIPIQTLSFLPGTDTWGLNIARLIRRRNEWVRWTNISLDRRFADVSQFGDLRGVAGLDQGRGLDVIPAVSFRFDWNKPGDDRDLRIKPGAEIVKKLTPSLNGTIIINPDFSDTRVDEIQTNLTRFNLFFPEQRQFFVRDSDIFDFGGLSEQDEFTGINGLPFFSRRIGLVGDTENPDTVDIDVGAKLSGRLGRYTIGVLNTQMDALPGQDARNLTVARIARDLGETSRLGGILTYGNPASDADNAVLGLDYRFRSSEVFGDQTFVADAYVMASSTAGIRGDELSYGLRLQYPNDIWYARANFTEIQEHFNPALGFVNRAGIRKYDGELRYRIRPAADAFLRTVDLGLSWNFQTDRDNALESSWIGVRFFTGETAAGDKLDLYYDYNTDRFDLPFEIHPGVVIAPGDYTWHDTWGHLETATGRPLRFVFEWLVGEFYDGNQRDVKAIMEWRPRPQLLLALERRFIDTNLPAGDFDVEINRLRIDLSLGPRISWTNFLQQETEMHFMTFNSQLRWILQPGRELWLTANHDWRREGNRYRGRHADVALKFFWTQRY